MRKLLVAVASKVFAVIALLFLYLTPLSDLAVSSAYKIHHAEGLPLLISFTSFLMVVAIWTIDSTYGPFRLLRRSMLKKVVVTVLLFFLTTGAIIAVTPMLK